MRSWPFTPFFCISMLHISYRQNRYIGIHSHPHQVEEAFFINEALNDMKGRKLNLGLKVRSGNSWLCWLAQGYLGYWADQSSKLGEISRCWVGGRHLQGIPRFWRRFSPPLWWCSFAWIFSTFAVPVTDSSTDRYTATVVSYPMLSWTLMFPVSVVAWLQLSAKWNFPSDFEGCQLARGKFTRWPQQFDVSLIFYMKFDARNKGCQASR